MYHELMVYDVLHSKVCVNIRQFYLILQELGLDQSEFKVHEAVGK